MGRGPKDIHTHLLGDLLVVRLQGVLTAAEQHLVKSLPAEKGQGPAQASADPSDRNGPSGHGSDGPGGHRRQGVEPAPRHQHRHRRGGRALHPGRSRLISASPGRNSLTCIEDTEVAGIFCVALRIFSAIISYIGLFHGCASTAPGPLTGCVCCSGGGKRGGISRRTCFLCLGQRRHDMRCFATTDAHFRLAQVAWCIPQSHDQVYFRKSTT